MAANRPDLPAVPRGRVGLWVALVALMLVALSLLVWLTIDYENGRAQDRVEGAATEFADDLRRQAQRSLEAVQLQAWEAASAQAWQQQAMSLLSTHREIVRLEHRDLSLHLVQALDSPFGSAVYRSHARQDLELEMQAACASARRTAMASFSHSYFVPQDDGTGQEVSDLCVVQQRSGQAQALVVAVVSLPMLLDQVLTQRAGNEYELTLVEPDGTRLAHAGTRRGLGVYRATQLVTLPGLAVLLQADSVRGRPGLIPNLAIALVLGLSAGLMGLVGLLVRDMRRRARAERAVADALAFRQAMEDSLVTGLRARDTHGRITYVNPAFCAMVGWSAEELLHQSEPPYWPPERIEEYRHRQQERRLSVDQPGDERQRQGFETLFMRRSGERFPVMIYEAPMRDENGRHTGWMSAALDVSGERRMEELSRQQQERLQATARLATVGEMASLLSHELNQPLAAIASYATGSLNLLESPPGDAQEALQPMLRQALARIAEQAERAGRVIKSVHGFVRRREHSRESLGCDQLVEAVLPLVRLQARKSGTRVEVSMPQPAPRVTVDRTMVEQVLLNLTRNGIQAMEMDTPLAQRVLQITVQPMDGRWVRVAVRDAGHGIAPSVAERLFTPFFTTRSEGMGLGLSLCRTVIEQHGGALDFGPAEGEPPATGTEFRFTLPASEATPRRARAADASSADA